VIDDVMSNITIDPMPMEEFILAPLSPPPPMVEPVLELLKQNVIEAADVGSLLEQFEEGTAQEYDCKKMESVTAQFRCPI